MKEGRKEGRKNVAEGDWPVGAKDGLMGLMYGKIGEVWLYLDRTPFLCLDNDL